MSLLNIECKEENEFFSDLLRLFGDNWAWYRIN
jgi:hypothetical protein